MKRKLKNIIQIIAGVSIIVAFLAGYRISSEFLTKPISNTQCEYLKQLASEVYEQGDKVIYEVPDDICLEKTETSIIISLDNNELRGRVIATLQNGELVYETDLRRGDAIFTNICAGLLLVTITAILWVIVEKIHGKKESS